MDSNTEEKMIDSFDPISRDIERNGNGDWTCDNQSSSNGTKRYIYVPLPDFHSRKRRCYEQPQKSIYASGSQMDSFIDTEFISRSSDHDRYLRHINDNNIDTTESFGWLNDSISQPRSQECKSNFTDLDSRELYQKTRLGDVCCDVSRQSSPNQLRSEFQVENDRDKTFINDYCVSSNREYEYEKGKTKRLNRPIEFLSTSISQARVKATENDEESLSKTQPNSDLGCNGSQSIFFQQVRSSFDDELFKGQVMNGFGNLPGLADDRGHSLSEPTMNDVQLQESDPDPSQLFYQVNRNQTCYIDYGQSYIKQFTSGVQDHTRHSSYDLDGKIAKQWAPSCASWIDSLPLEEIKATNYSTSKEPMTCFKGGTRNRHHWSEVVGSKSLPEESSPDYNRFSDEYQASTEVQELAHPKSEPLIQSMNGSISTASSNLPSDQDESERFDESTNGDLINPRIDTRPNKYNSDRDRLKMTHETRERFAVNIEYLDILAPKVMTRGLVNEAFFLVFENTKPCVMTSYDKVGKCKRQVDDYVGICCKHCNGLSGSCRFFPGNLNSFLNGRNVEEMKCHLIVECPCCPQNIKDEIKIHSLKESKNIRKKYQRKKFFEHVWNKLRYINNDRTLLNILKLESCAIFKERFDEKPKDRLNWDMLIGDSDIIRVEDLNVASEKCLAVAAQFKICFVTEEDRGGRCKNDVGFPGMCCRHCNGKPGSRGFGRYFPSTERSCSQMFYKQAEDHIIKKCDRIPNEIRNTIMQLIQDKEQDQNSKRVYGARERIVSKIWDRLEQYKNLISNQDNEKTDPYSIDWELVLNGCEIILWTDPRDLVDEVEFISMAQMKPCLLTMDDKKGSWKDNDLGDPGFCCRHCGDKRKFPKRFECFLQTTSARSIRDHIEVGCKHCPKEIRDVLLRLRKSELPKQPLKHGYRKVFYQMIWDRLTNTSNIKRDMQAQKIVS